MKRKIVGIIVAVLALVSGCSTDLNVLADYKETAIVYGLLSQSDTAQYIKINKAFLGPGNALEIAQIFDSISYANQLTVQLEQIKNGTKVSTITLTKDSSIAKPSGIFSAPKQILYKTKTPLDQLSDYNLVITNNSTHNVVTGTTKLVDNVSVTQPYSGSVNFTSTVKPFRIEWTTSSNGKIYGVTLRFYYLEKDKSTSVITPKYVDWVFGNQISKTTQGGEVMYVEFMGEAIYQYLQYKLPIDNNVIRYLPTSGPDVDFIFTIGAEDLNTFIEVSRPSTGIIQERPQYTNLKNGFGLFSARLVQFKSGVNKLLPASIDSIYCGRYTKDLFDDPLTPDPNRCP
jgi:hypothetical protein